jgi:hypothetical protein
MSNQIVANSVLFYPNFIEQFSKGKIDNWRQLCFKNIGNYELFSKNEIDSMMDISYDKDIENIKFNIIIENMILGSIDSTNIIFFAVDSNVICYNDILEGMKNIHKKIINNQISSNPIVIFVDTMISQIENKFKLKNKEKYPNVNFDFIQNYFHFINEENMFYDDNEVRVDYMYHISESTICDYIYQEETEYLKYNDGFYKGSVNEINDNVQLNVLIDMRNQIIGSNVIFLTNDRELQEKCIDLDVYYQLY